MAYKRVISDFSSFSSWWVHSQKVIVKYQNNNIKYDNGVTTVKNVLKEEMLNQS